MAYKTWLVEGYCPTDHYTCLMPVEYESRETGGVIQDYHKKRMICRHALDGSCDLEDNCKFLKNAPEVLDKGAPWYEGERK